MADPNQPPPPAAPRKDPQAAAQAAPVVTMRNIFDEPTKRKMDPKAWALAVAFRSKEAKLHPARSFARFLCGITSPQLSRAKLSSKELFGVFAEVPFGEVLARAEELAAGA